MKIEIEANLYLRKLTLDDLEDYFNCYQSEEAKMGFNNVPKTLDAAKAELTERIKEYNKDKTVGDFFVIIYENKFAGFVELEALNEPNYEHQGNLGYCISKDFFLEGLATKTAITASDYTFEKFNLHRLEGVCKITNKASARILEKVGFRFEGFKRKNSFHDGKYVDDMMWSKIR